jgi:hypothetical protein
VLVFTNYPPIQPFTAGFVEAARFCADKDTTRLGSLALTWVKKNLRYVFSETFVVSRLQPSRALGFAAFRFLEKGALF